MFADVLRCPLRPRNPGGVAEGQRARAVDATAARWAEERVEWLRGGTVAGRLAADVRLRSLLPLILSRQNAGARVRLDNAHWRLFVGDMDALALSHAGHDTQGRTVFVLPITGRRAMRADFGVDWEGVNVGHNGAPTPRALPVQDPARTGQPSEPGQLSDFQASLVETLAVTLDVEIGAVTVPVCDLLRLERGAKLAIDLPEQPTAVIRLAGEQVGTAALYRDDNGLWLEMVSVGSGCETVDEKPASEEGGTAQDAEQEEDQ